jgi:hypothetical protein
MSGRRIVFGILAALLAAGVGYGQESPPARETGVRRYALVIGANGGGKDRVRLRYAVSDARMFRGLLTELGGVAEEDGLLLLDPSPQTIRGEMGKLRARLESLDPRPGRVEMIFYYSGHSDDTHLLLDDGTISYEELRGTINDMPADVRIAILDSCASGAFTRIKGGKKKPAFLLDEARTMRGYAFLTSSSSTEASQESDLIRSSFFTHYLTSGLRGAADLDQDGQVTLNEAYQFSFAETLAETTQTRGGPQHPSYDIQMSGAGDVVMTDIRNGTALLALGPEIDGRVFVHDQNNALVVEVSKSLGRTITLGLDEGRFRVINIAEGRIREAAVALKAGKETSLPASGFVPSAAKYTTPRGDRSMQVREEFLARGFEGRPITTNIVLATGATLNRGEYLVGLGPISYGVSDHLQIGLNPVSFLFQVYNAQAKAALVKSRAFALAAGLDWQSFELNVAGAETDFTGLSPFLAVSTRLSSATTLHLYGQTFRFFGNADVKNAAWESDVVGTWAGGGFDLSLSRGTKFLAEGGYDFTFDVTRTAAAFLFGGRTIRLKLGLQYFRPGRDDGFTKVVLALWWRFGS